MEHAFIYLIAFFAAGLAPLSGFGLGTILTPVFLLFYEPKVAIFLVAVVHLLNGLLKFVIFRKHVDFEILKRFGILALIGAFIGAFGQARVDGIWLKKLIGIVLIYLGFQEWFPKKAQFSFPKFLDPVGGFLSGLLGGLVGNQGAIRSAFLLNYPMTKESFIATGVVLACIIDIVRIPVYWMSYEGAIFDARTLILLIVVTFAGTFTGSLLLKRFSASGFKKSVSVLVILMGVYFLLF